eukprot:4743056-Amphidinium_carterae.1
MEYTQPPDRLSVVSNVVSQAHSALVLPRGEVLEIDGEAVQQRDGLHLHKVDAQIRLGFVRKASEKHPMRV